MRILSCHIDAFGKFKNADFDFQNLTVLCKENGFGKTTLAQFIKAMFYSLPASSKKAGVVSERDFYRPFNFDGQFGGRLTFECDKGTYVVVRMFGKTPTLDKFMLFDKHTNLISNDFSSNLGNELFGVGCETFENSTFFGQQKLTSEINDDIRASLSTGVLSGDDIDNLATAVLKLQKKAKEFKSEQNALGCDHILSEIDNLNRKEMFSKSRLNDIETDIRETKIQLDRAKISAENSQENEVAQVAQQKLVSENIIENLEKNIDLKNKRREDVENQKVLSEGDYSFLKNVYDPHKIKSASMRLSLYGILMVLGVIGLIVGAILKNMIILYSFGGATIFGVLLVVLNLVANNSLAKSKTQHSEILKKYNLKQSQIDQILADFDKNSVEIRFLDGEIQQLKSQLLSHKLSLADLDNSFRQKYGCAVEEYVTQKSLAKDAVIALDKKLAIFENDRQRYLDELENFKSTRFDLEEDYQERKAKFDLLTHKMDVLAKTVLFLNKAKDGISNRYIEPVTDRFNKIYREFLKDGEKILIDSNLNMKLNDSLSDVFYLSAGLFDLVYICKRFALIDLLYKKEKPVLILDDPFANLDDEKLDIAKKMIKQMAENYQILLFTCQKARA